MLQGSCHCGGAGWRLEGAPVSATSCNCSICRRHGALWAYGFEGDDIAVSGQTATCAWGGRWLAFHFCANCACVVAWLANSPGADGRRRGGVNLRLAEDPAAVAAVPIIHHDTVTHEDLPLDGKRVADVWF